MGSLAVLLAVALNLWALWSAARSEASVERWEQGLDKLAAQLEAAQRDLADLRRT